MIWILFCVLTKVLLKDVNFYVSVDGKGDCTSKTKSCGLDHALKKTCHETKHIFLSPGIYTIKPIRFGVDGPIILEADQERNVFVENEDSHLPLLTYVTNTVAMPVDITLIGIVLQKSTGNSIFFNGTNDATFSFVDVVFRNLDDTFFSVWTKLTHLSFVSCHFENNLDTFLDLTSNPHSLRRFSVTSCHFIDNNCQGPTGCISLNLGTETSTDMDGDVSVTIDDTTTTNNSCEGCSIFYLRSSGSKNVSITISHSTFSHNTNERQSTSPKKNIINSGAASVLQIETSNFHLLSLSISHSEFSSNTAKESSGTIQLEYSGGRVVGWISVFLSRIRATSNIAEISGGFFTIHALDLNFTCEHSTFLNNLAHTGGVFHLYTERTAQCAMHNTTFTSNSAFSNGGAVTLQSRHHYLLELSQCTFYDNLAFFQGGCLAINLFGAPPTPPTGLHISATTFQNNTSELGGVLYGAAPSGVLSVTLRDCQVTSNGAARGGVAYLQGNGNNITFFDGTVLRENWAGQRDGAAGIFVVGNDVWMNLAGRYIENMGSVVFVDAFVGVMNVVLDDVAVVEGGGGRYFPLMKFSQSTFGSGLDRDDNVISGRLTVASESEERAHACVYLTNFNWIRVENLEITNCGIMVSHVKNAEMNNLKIQGNGSVLIVESVEALGLHGVTAMDGGGLILREGINRVIGDGLELVRNRGRYGGGLYMHVDARVTEFIDLQNLRVKNNSAEYGGGVYIEIVNFENGKTEEEEEEEGKDETFEMMRVRERLVEERMGRFRRIISAQAEVGYTLNTLTESRKCSIRIGCKGRVGSNDYEYDSSTIEGNEARFGSSFLLNNVVSSNNNLLRVCTPSVIGNIASIFGDVYFVNNQKHGGGKVDISHIFPNGFDKSTTTVGSSPVSFSVSNKKVECKYRRKDVETFDCVLQKAYITSLFGDRIVAFPDFVKFFLRCEKEDSEFFRNDGFSFVSYRYGKKEMHFTYEQSTQKMEKKEMSCLVNMTGFGGLNVQNSGTFKLRFKTCLVQFGDGKCVEWFLPVVISVGVVFGTTAIVFTSLFVVLICCVYFTTGEIIFKFFRDLDDFSRNRGYIHMKSNVVITRLFFDIVFCCRCCSYCAYELNEWNGMLKHGQSWALRCMSCRLCCGKKNEEESEYEDLDYHSHMDVDGEGRGTEIQYS